MQTKRRSGIVLHISSLPGRYGIGSLGAQAFRMIDFLADAGQRFWQILPLLPPGGGDSPYQSLSAFAGNPYFIDLDLLREDGLLTDEECRTAERSCPDGADFAFLQETRLPLLRRAFDRMGDGHREAVRQFTAENDRWLPDFALFTSLREHFGGAALPDWPDAAILHRTPAAMRRYTELLSGEISFYCFLQYLFYAQWKAVKTYANRRDIRIIGDLPIYVSPDSADVWAHPRLFRLDDRLSPQFVAGVSADSFSPTGQHWGNPLYNWNAHKKEDYTFWMLRIGHSLSCFDLLRFDHFRGFHSYFEIPAACPDASCGRWRRGPGMEFLHAVFSEFPPDRFIAEDLGELTDSARAFVIESGLPGMRVLVDAFDPAGESAFLPHNVPPLAVYYTSTHDTPTFLEWLFERASPEQRRFAVDYLRLRADEGYGWGAICGAWASPAALAMSPLQDILGLGGDARMNTPATVGGLNWRWRVREEALNGEVSARLRQITKTYARI